MGVISRIIGYPLGWVIWLAYKLCGSYALSIVIFTLFTKLILFPISVKTQKSSAAMTALGPKLEQLKKKYANNQQKLQEATMELYAEENINPMSSCTPLLIQLPILYGIFDVVYRPITHILRVSSDVIDQATEICRNLVGYGDQTYFKSRPELYIIQAIHDPAVSSQFADLPDGFYDTVRNFDNNLFGIIDLGVTPTFHPENGWDAGSVGLIIIPIVCGIVQLLSTFIMTRRQKKTNPAQASQMASMNMMNYFFCIMFVAMAFASPAAIGFYWAVSGVLQLISSAVLNKIYTPEYVAKLLEKDKKKKKAKKKVDMMQRYQQLLAEQNGTAAASSANKNGVAGAKLSDDDGFDIKLSKSQQKDIQSKLISENRKKVEDKYRDEELTEEENRLLEEARRRQAEKYGDN
ncbi:MAG: membrane protein insertase YidC [Oscillospiraceae bacterium]|nr:membrane protein insertase YidC [Oscillospiraceae bacterium]